MCEETTAAIERLTRVMEQQSSAINRLGSMIGKASRDLNSYVDERIFSSGDTTIKVVPQTANPVLITAIIVTVSSNATLTLGDRVYAIASGGDNDAQFKNVMIVLKQSDLRQLVQATSGAMSLELMGVELPITGIW